MWTSRSRFAAIAVAALAAACGGGGDGGGGVSPQLPTYVTISAANQDTVARASIASILPFTGVPLLSTSPSPPRATTAEASGSAAHGHTGLTYLALRSVGIGYPQPPSAPTGIARPLARHQDTLLCLVSGSWTRTFDDNDNSGTLSAGDALSVLFVQCSDGVGSTINGGMAMSIASYSETPATADLAGSMTFQSLAMVDEGVSFSLNGDVGFSMNLALGTNGLDARFSYTVASGGLTVVDSGSAIGFADTFSYRAGYTVTERDFTPNAQAILQGIPWREELTASGDFGSVVLGGDLRLSTAQPFKFVWTDPEGDNFPNEGQLVATGLNSTKLSLSATQTSQVRMDMCDDGDGAWEGTTMVDWGWLLQ
jgi:hypothetical protein